MKLLHVIWSSFLLAACATGQKPVRVAGDESSFVYVYNCHYYQKSDFIKLFGYRPNETMLLANHPNYSPWTDSCDHISTRSFPKYSGAQIDKKIQQRLSVDTTGRFDAATAEALIWVVNEPQQKILDKKQLALAKWGLEEFGGKPIITEALYKALLQ